jgi:hypothetical protein
MLSVEDLFLAGIGCDIAGGYLVSRGLLAPIPQLATLGGTMFALERPRAPFAVEDRIRGSVGLVTLVLGFALQAVGYALLLSNTRVRYGSEEAIIGVGIALALGLLIPLAESRVRPWWRDRILVRVARFDYEGGHAPLERPVAHVLRAFGEQTGRPLLTDEDDVAYCARVFGVEAAVPSG